MQFTTDSLTFLEDQTLRATYTDQGFTQKNTYHINFLDTTPGIGDAAPHLYLIDFVPVDPSQDLPSLSSHNQCQYWAMPPGDKVDGVTVYCMMTPPNDGEMWVSLQFNSKYRLNLMQPLYGTQYANSFSAESGVGQDIRDLAGTDVEMTWTFNTGERPDESLTLLG